MEPQNYKIIKNFIKQNEVDKILSWVDGLTHNPNNPNHHLTELSKSLKGKSFIFDIFQTPITRYITKFQSTSEVKNDRLPSFIIALISRISLTYDLPTDHIFLQVVDMEKGGKIDPHYDASVDGYINLKCNISVLSEDYSIFIGDESQIIQATDLYSFEASLYKHWTNEFTSRRVFLSFGFMVDYKTMGRNESDPRIRLSKRIQKYFQNL
jgi:hypothetical protein